MTFIKVIFVISIHDVIFKLVQEKNSRFLFPDLSERREILGKSEPLKKR